MEITHYRDLFIRGPRQALDRVPDAVEAELSDGWSRDHEAEHRASGLGTSYYVFECAKRERPPRPPANLFLSPIDSEPPALSCVNVVPKESHELSHAEYNAIVGEFAEEYLRPIAEYLGLEVDLQEPSLPFSAYFSTEARAKLEAFSAAANKSSGGTHPFDRKRWFTFIGQVYADGGRLDSEVLSSWLVQEGWRQDQASRLVSEATFGIGLLDHWTGATE